MPAGHYHAIVIGAGAPTTPASRPRRCCDQARRSPRHCRRPAREAVSGTLDVGQTLAWRDFMVSDYDDSAQEQWLDDNGIDLLRGSRRLLGPGRVGVGEGQEWMQQATLAIRARIPLELVYASIQPFPTFSDRCFYALAELVKQVRGTSR